LTTPIISVRLPNSMVRDPKFQEKTGRIERAF
jgi:hypothetical protein